VAELHALINEINEKEAEEELTFSLKQVILRLEPVYTHSLG